uniref:Uncharacterized protein n=1 Tax=Manihot esculenta TaxID=3983 RepID=A0A2C9WPL7_MANES
MADSRSYTKLHLSPEEFQANPSSYTRHKSYSQILSPKFINQSILTKFWEFVHFLFIGVAVSYGLLSRRNVEVDFDTHSNNFDDPESSYVSRIFHVFPSFEDGYENSCGADEKTVHLSWNSQCYRVGDSTVSVTNGSSVIDEQSKTGSINSENGTEISLEQDENSVGQAWNSQYLQGESVVLVSQANYEIGELEKPEQVAGYEPLRVPVMSSKSKSRSLDSAQFSNGSESISSLIGSSSSSGRIVDEKHFFGDTGNSNTDEKFNGSFPLPSEIPRRSISGRAEMKEIIGPVDGDPSHIQPLSVDETQFQSPKPQSFRSTTASFSSQARSILNSPTELFPSHSVSTDRQNSGTEDSASQSPQTTVYREARLNAFHLRKYTSGSLFKKNLHVTSKDKLKDLSGAREDSLGVKENEQVSLGSDKKPGTIGKATSRGKSLRINRSGLYTAEAIKAEEMSTTHFDDQAGKGSNEAKAVNIRKNEMKGNMSIGISEKNIDTHCNVPMATYAKYLKREKVKCLENVAVESEKDSENNKTNSVPVRLDEGSRTGTEFVSDAGLDPNEVDKKAGEFIAKFREQIRLQKEASVERSRRMRISSKHLR